MIHLIFEKIWYLNSFSYINFSFYFTEKNNNKNSKFEKCEQIQIFILTIKVEFSFETVPNFFRVRSFPIFYGDFQLHNISNVLTSSHDHYLWTNTSQKTLEKHVQNVSCENGIWNLSSIILLKNTVLLYEIHWISDPWFCIFIFSSNQTSLVNFWKSLLLVDLITLQPF